MLYFFSIGGNNRRLRALFVEIEFMPSLECKHPTCSGAHCRRPKKEKKRYVLKRGGPIQKVAPKRKEAVKQYSEDRKRFLKERPLCEARLVCCRKKATDVHHMAGRQNKKLNDIDDWLPVCRPCHNWITDNSKEAIEMRLSHRRIT